MSATALEILHVAQAINQGVVLLDEFMDLAGRDDITEEDAQEIIQDHIAQMQALRDND